MNYTGRYGLEINPFIKNGKDVLVETNEYKEVKFRLNYLLQTKGFGVLTGGAGRGKTTSVRQWANELNPSAYKVVYISLSTVTVIEFYRQMALNLGIEPYKSRQFPSHSGNYRKIQTRKKDYTCIYI